MMDSEYLQFVGAIIEPLERLKIRYAVGGSLASSIYGEIRSTFDIDISIQLTADSVPELVKSYEAHDWYAFPEGIHKAIRDGGEFQIIDGSTGFKADFYVTGSSTRQMLAVERARQLPYGLGGRTANFMPPEDVILYKLEWYALGKSEKHLRDIRAMLSRQKIDNAYVVRWADDLNVREFWDDLYVQDEDQAGEE